MAFHERMQLDSFKSSSRFVLRSHFGHFVQREPGMSDPSESLESDYSTGRGAAIRLAVGTIMRPKPIDIPL